MSAAGYVNQRNISSEYDYLKRLQVQRDRLEQTSKDYKQKGYMLNNLSSENSQLKQDLEYEMKEKEELIYLLDKKLADLTSDFDLVTGELEVTKVELDRYKVYAEEIEKNNQNWRRECEIQENKLAETKEESESMKKKIGELEDKLRYYREEYNNAKLEKNAFVQLKSALERQKHNYQMLETDYTDLKRQNQELELYLESLEENRIKSEGIIHSLKNDHQLTLQELDKEIGGMRDEILTHHQLSNTQENFIEELKQEIGELREQNHFLKSKLNISNNNY